MVIMSAATLKTRSRTLSIVSHLQSVFPACKHGFAYFFRELHLPNGRLEVNVLIDIVHSNLPKVNNMKKGT